MNHVPRAGQTGLRFRIAMSAVTGPAASPLDLAGATAKIIIWDPDNNPSKELDATPAGSDILFTDEDGAATAREGRWAVQPIVIRASSRAPGSLVPYRVGQ